MELSQEQVNVHNALIAAGAKIVSSYALTGCCHVKGEPGFFVRRRIRNAIRHYTKALSIFPNVWSSMWALGKLHQRLGEHEHALKWFTCALAANPGQVDILREAGISALSLGAKKEALEYCFAAVKCAPDDLGLQSNLALAYLIAGDDHHAEECARAASGDPSDVTSHEILALVLSVRNGGTQRPKRIK